MKGEVVGINTAIASPTGGNVGIAFAIPAATAVPIVQTLRGGGQVVRGYLGVALQALDDEIARSIGLRGRDGALVAEISAEGPAARAGVRPGDVILSVGGRPVADSRDLARVVAEHRPGARLNFEFVRDGRRMRATATLAATPEEETGRGKSRPGSGDNASAALGMHVTPARGGGVRILSVRDDSEAAARGLSPGDVILEAGGRPCGSAADLLRAADSARRNGRGVVLLRVQTGNLPRYVGLPLSTDQG
jgi:serine protease Do